VSALPEPLPSKLAGFYRPPDYARPTPTNHHPAEPPQPPVGCSRPQSVSGELSHEAGLAFEASLAGSSTSDEINFHSENAAGFEASRLAEDDFHG
jgi:hypothetical protein